MPAKAGIHDLIACGAAHEDVDAGLRRHHGLVD
jgi:hypothetical protein